MRKLTTVASPTSKRTHLPRIAAVACVLGLFAFASTGSASPSRGYQPRACGFDENFNGTPGESGDCNVICSGANPSHTPDIDGNGVADLQWFVDCDGGNDSGNGQTAGSAKKHLQAMLDAMPAPAAGQIQVLCFTGTCKEGNITPKRSGATASNGTAFWTTPQTGSEARSFQLPRYPLIISGWDKNAPFGDYPPHDTNDKAVLEGTGFGSGITNTVPVGRIEYAHFAAQNYGLLPGVTGEFMVVANGNTATQHIYLHDIELSNILGNRAMQDYTRVFNFFQGGGRVLNHVAITNLKCANCGGFFFRGQGAQSPNDGPYRMQNISYTAHGCNTSGANACSGAENPAHAAVSIGKLWNYVTGIEIIDSTWDANVANWTPQPNGGAGFTPTGVTPDACSRDWTIRNNSFTDFANPLYITPAGSTGHVCTGDIDRIVFDQNTITNNYAPYIWGDQSITVLPGEAPSGANGNTASDLQEFIVTNNVISTTAGTQTHFFGQWGYDGPCVGGSHAGRGVFVNNTFSGPSTRWPILVFGNPQGPELACPQGNFVVENNIIRGTNPSDGMICMEYAAKNWSADNNVYDSKSGSQYLWNSNNDCRNPIALAAWRTASKGDAHAKECKPSLNSADLHLLAADSCARNSGQDMSAITQVDIDGQSRPRGVPWDVGADQFSVGTGRPSPPVLVGLSVANP